MWTVCCTDSDTHKSPASDIEMVSIDVGSLVPFTTGNISFRLYALYDLSSHWGVPYMDNVAASVSADGAVQVAGGPYLWPSDGSPLRFIGIMRGDGSDAPDVEDGYVPLEAGAGPKFDVLLSNNALAGKYSPVHNKNMDFRHLMTKLNVKVGFGSGVEHDVVSFSLKAGSRSGKYDVLDPDGRTVTPSGDTYTIVYNGDSGEEVHYLIPDGQIITEVTGLKLGNKIYGNVAILPPTIISGPMTLTSSSSYTLNIKILNPPNGADNSDRIRRSLSMVSAEFSASQ